jgi:O-antigen/teichoic acid export membrane protein
MFATKRRGSIPSLWRFLSSLRLRVAAGSLSRNALFSTAQSVVALACLFTIYRLLVQEVGLERLGVWSLLLAASALVRIGDVSGAAALARFVAAAGHADRAGSPRDYVHTVLLTCIAMNFVFAAAIYFSAPLALPLVVGPQHLAEARSLVPFVIAIMLLGAFGAGVTSAIDGAQRADQRALVMMGANLVYLGAAWFCIPRFGMIGFALAQTLQLLVVIVVGWIVLRGHVAGLGWFPSRWSRAVFAQTGAYALKLNAMGIMMMLFDPLAKLGFNHAGGPILVAYYELATRLVTQIRGLVVAGATPLTPAFARFRTPRDPAFGALLEKATRISALAAVATAFLSLTGAPLMSLVILGKIDPELLRMNTALTLGWSINLLCLGFYMAAQGIGVLRWNLASHAVLALCVVVGVFVLVPQFGADGLIGAIVVGLVLSTVMVLAGNARFFGFFSLPLANVIFISGSVVFMLFIFSFNLNGRLFPIL